VEPAFPQRRSRAALAFWSIFALALALRLTNAATSSLKLDDFHSLHHARAPDLATFFAVLEQDNHPPLAFLPVVLVRALLGESPLALRLPALLAGLTTLALVWRLGARLGSTRVQALATLLVAASALHVECSSDVRMYALLGLASAGLLEALVTLAEDHRGAWRITLWSVIGLHTHYHFVYVLAVAGTLGLILLASGSERRRDLRAGVIALALSALLSAPWYLGGFPAQLAHGLAPGGSNATAARLAEGLKNLVFLNVSAGGTLARWVGLGASALFLGLALSGLVRALGSLRHSRRPAALLVAGVAFLVPALTYVAARLVARAGFEWRYFAGVVPAFCLLVAAESEAPGRFLRWRRALVVPVVLAALLNAGVNALDPGEEDYRDAVAWIVARAEPEDAVVAADWQPTLFPHSLAWAYYAPRLAQGRPLPELSPYRDDFLLLDRDGLAARERVFCCLRSLPAETKILRTLRELFPHEEQQSFGRSIHVHVFTRPGTGR